ncbi:PIN domain-containing protein [Nocardia sp. NPDC004711]
MPIIVVDTNIFRGSPMLRSRVWDSLAAHREEWKTQVVVPEVAVVETVNMMRVEWEKTLAAVEVLHVGEFGLSGLQQEMAEKIRTYIDEYEQSVRDRLSELGALVVPPPAIDYTDIVHRAVYRRKPYGTKENPDGFRDAVVWHTLLSVAKDNPDEQVWLVSNNTGDFGPEDGVWTDDGRGNRNSCPIRFHPHLADELSTLGLSDRVRYVTNLQRLEQHIAASFDPIAAEDLDQRLERLDDAALAKRLDETIRGCILDPEKAALALEVTGAVVAGTGGSIGPWEFAEAAGRGNDGWTARFVLDTEVELTVFHGASASTQAKVLRLSGSIAVGTDDHISDLTITGIEALPDDPMRESWELANSYRSAAGGPAGSVANPQRPADFGSLLGSFQMSGLEANAGLIGMSKLMDGLHVNALVEKDKLGDRLPGLKSIADMFKLDGVGVTAMSATDKWRENAIQTAMSGADMWRESVAERAFTGMSKLTDGFAINAGYEALKAQDRLLGLRAGIDIANQSAYQRATAAAPQWDVAKTRTGAKNTAASEAASGPRTSVAKSLADKSSAADAVPEKALAKEGAAKKDAAGKAAGKKTTPAKPSARKSAATKATGKKTEKKRPERPAS